MNILRRIGYCIIGIIWIIGGIIIIPLKGMTYYIWGIEQINEALK